MINYLSLNKVAHQLSKSHFSFQNIMEEEWSGWLRSYNILHILQQCTISGAIDRGVILHPKDIQPYNVSLTGDITALLSIFKKIGGEYQKVMMYYVLVSFDFILWIGPEFSVQNICGTDKMEK